MAAGAVLGIAHELGDGSGGVGLAPGLFGHADRTLGRGFRNNADPQRLQQSPGQRRHPAIFYQIVKVLQGKADPGAALVFLQRFAELFKRQSFFRQLSGLPQQQDHNAGGGAGIQHKDLFFRVLRQNQISRGHGGVIGAGKLRGNGHTDRFLALFKGCGVSGGRGTGGGGRMMGQHSQQSRDIQRRGVRVILPPHMQAHGCYRQTGVRGIEFPGDQITAAVADKIQHDGTLLPRPAG